MARKVIWSQEAATDLEALAQYIARDSVFYAAAFVQEILDASRSLQELAKRVRIVPELSDPNIRELFVREHRLVYRRPFDPTHGAWVPWRSGEGSSGRASS